MPHAEPSNYSKTHYAGADLGILKGGGGGGGGPAEVSSKEGGGGGGQPLTRGQFVLQINKIFSKGVRTPWTPHLDLPLLCSEMRETVWVHCVKLCSNENS